ncbi:SUF system NifU family Fe-S cluster assembly protein [Anaerobacillus alkaliphilus]|uniref:SUF system NifU family Fe-S cluster assembly protein n=1 Tax=Anaerobacillus alkaliphilus TaxID=1548597 RepID=A0A4V1LGV1_9BACI|nr:SUF system NifU family Fe-S cluster assembly protein [Anaerobacillus alkaliphilus]RXJ04015.1 SUF system NifU family Fe-S cluster assembly protein [Anaerobacillus alkaliphilus]
MLDQIYRQLVIDHAKNRRNYKRLDGPDVKHIHYKNPTCGDVMTLFLTVKDHRINDISFVGEGCSISMASVSIMTELLKGTDIEEVIKLREGMERMIRYGEIPSDCDLGDALALVGVHKLRARHNCALMGWQALDRVLELKKD